MKPSNRLKRLEARRADYDRSRSIAETNEKHSRSGRKVYHRPGSLSK